MAALSSGQFQHLQVELAKPRMFGKADIGEQGLVRGWAVPEDGHTWNDGLEAVLSLEAPHQPLNAVTLAVDGIPYVFGEAQRQELTLYANGSYVGFWRFTQRQLVVIEARIESEQWVIRRGLAYLTLTWLMPGSSRPKEIGDGSDNRMLGFAFRSLCITNQKDNG